MTKTRGAAVLRWQQLVRAAALVGALISLFLPLWQSLGIALGAGAAIVLDALSPSQRSPPA